MRKREVLVLFFVLIVLINLISAQQENMFDAFQCIDKKISENPNLGLEEAVFSILSGVKDEKVLKVLEDQKNPDENCWPVSCDIKSTALVLLAKKYSLGEDGEKLQGIIDWIKSKTHSIEGLNWYLQITIKNRAEGDCEIDYGGGKYNVHVDEEMKLNSENLGNCLSISGDGYRLRISDECVDQTFYVSCSYGGDDEGFLTNLIYTENGGDVWYPSSTTHSANSGETTQESISAKCFGMSGCDYESTLWATVALQTAGEEITEYVPYLKALASSNRNLFPSAFLYYLVPNGKEVYSQEMLNRAFTYGGQAKYWDANGFNVHNTALAIFALGPDHALVSGEEGAVNYLMESQEKSGENKGCWNNGNLRDSAFVVYAMKWSRANYDDIDSDGILNKEDNCPETYNPNQEDLDNDGIGDVCDEDADGDGIKEDGDGSGVVGDSACNESVKENCDDNCAGVPNPSQADIDGDGKGNECDEDTCNNNGVCDEDIGETIENCPNENCPEIENIPPPEGDCSGEGYSCKESCDDLETEVSGLTCDSGVCCYNQPGGENISGTGEITTTECGSAGYYCVGSWDCQANNGNILSDYLCEDWTKVCCDVDVAETPEKNCFDLGGVVCPSGTQCSVTPQTSSDGACCVEGTCEDISQGETSGQNGEVCGNGIIETGEQCESDFDCGEGMTCNEFCNCEEKSSEGKGMGWLIWLLVILIILVILGIVFRNKLRIWYYQMRGKAKSGPAGKQPPRFGQPFPRHLPPRRIVPRFSPRGGSGFSRVLPKRIIRKPVSPKQPPKAPTSKSDKEFEETMRKLREMSK